MIEVENLTKSFRDRRKGILHAVKGVTFASKPGEVFGLLGPNGAGKTTALRIISTALKPTEGRGTVMGFDCAREPEKVRQSIGFLAANTGLYGRLTPRETLRYFGSLFGMGHRQLDSRIEELAFAFAMTDFLDRPCDKLSTGMKQKVNIARSVIHSPEAMILDEPTTGLDVLTSRHIVEFVRKCRNDQKTVLLSTHIMSEVKRLCDRVGIIHQGQLRFVGTLTEFEAAHGSDLEEAFINIVGGPVP
ncbi:ATP-binding cassette domain-containing protein [Candidatus Sumerlaeota bacterium]|nr:ATP-binding cassette domain-containing protein [Candidatus Sumerlaeota bacterium]